MKYFATVGLMGAGLIALSYVAVPQMTTLEYEAMYDGAVTSIEEKTIEEPTVEVIDDREVVTHVPLPKPVQAIYMTSCVAGTPSFREKLIDFILETEINSVIIDIKDYSGTISFNPTAEEWKPAWENARCGAWDMKELVATLHEEDIFVAGRITVFQDPFYATKHLEEAVQKLDGSIWEDHKGLSFVDVASQKYWDHIILLARDSYNLGFDELNFDYVRYPSDGNMQNIAFPRSMEGKYGADKQANLEAFFAYLYDHMSDETLFADVRHENTGRASSTPFISADLFGMTTTNYDDLSIGQVLERTMPYFDFVLPMVYPSHYPDSFLGLGNPNDYPYKIVNYAMQSGANRATASTTYVNGFLHERIGTSTPAIYKKPVWTADKLRTWIQDFDYGGDYDAVDVRAQIQASVDAGVDSYMVWAPSNIYTRAAFDSAGE